MKFVVRPQHIVSLGGYIVETQFPYRNVIVMNPTSEPIKVEIPIFDEEWIDEHRQLGLEITPLTEQDSFLSNFRRQKMRLEQIKEK